MEVPMLKETMQERRNQTLTKEWERGYQEGRITGIQKLLLYEMTLRFGRLPIQARRRIKAISSTRKLLELGRNMLAAKSLQHLGF
jgi:hypothetical protein